MGHSESGMHLQFYLLARAPFQPGAEAAFFWKGEKYRRALAVLRRAAQEGGVSLLTGDVGTGKTAVVHALLRETGRQAMTCLISDPDLTVADFYQLVLHGFRVRRSVDTREEFHEHLGGLLRKAARRRRQVLLILDEAQRMPPELASELEATAAFCAGTGGGMHICLVGQTDGGRGALAPVLGPLARHIDADFHIQPLDADETAAYVRHRLRVAGAQQEIFSEEALQEVHRQSDGIPIQINLICDFALFSGFAERAPVITDDIVRWSADGLRLPEPLEEVVEEEPQAQFFTEEPYPETAPQPDRQEAFVPADDEPPDALSADPREECVIAPDAPAQEHRPPHEESLSALETEPSAAPAAPEPEVTEPAPQPDAVEAAVEAPEAPAAAGETETPQPADDKTCETPPADEPTLAAGEPPAHPECADVAQAPLRPQTAPHPPEISAPAGLPEAPLRRSRLRPAMAAAAVLLLAAAGGYLLLAKSGGISIQDLLQRFTPRVSATPQAPAFQAAVPPAAVEPAVPQAFPVKPATPVATTQEDRTPPAPADETPPASSGRPSQIIEEDLTDETPGPPPQAHAAVEPAPAPQTPPPAAETEAPQSTPPSPAPAAEAPAESAPAPEAPSRAEEDAALQSTPRSSAPAAEAAPEPETVETPTAPQPPSAEVPPAAPEPEPAPAAAPASASVQPRESDADQSPASASDTDRAPSAEHPQPEAERAAAQRAPEQTPVPAPSAEVSTPAPPPESAPTASAQPRPGTKHRIPASSLLRDILKDGAFFESSPQPGPPREATAAPPPEKKTGKTECAAPQPSAGEPDPSAVINWLLKRKGK